MKKWLFLLLVLAAALLGCTQHTQVISTNIPVNNTIFFSNGVGILYTKDGQVFMAVINTTNTTPFKKVTVPAKLVFNGDLLEKVVVNGTVYNVSNLYIRKVVNGTIVWEKVDKPFEVPQDRTS